MNNMLRQPKGINIGGVLNKPIEEEKPLQAPSGDPYKANAGMSGGVGAENSNYDPLVHKYNALRSAVRRRKI